MKKILIATDGSEESRQAVDFGLELANEQAAPVVLVHVAPAVDVVPTSGFGMTGAVPHELTDYDWSPLTDARALAEELGIDVRTQMLRGDTVDEIVAYADAV